ncbi:MAG: hypothetical protein WBQ23_10475 [Bacteroidota bacterium]
MKSSGFIRRMVLSVLLIAFVAAFTVPSVYAQSDEQVTLEQMKMKLRDEGKNRNLSQLTHAELELIKPSEGGLISNLFNPELVTKVGNSTFIMNMLAITLVITISGFVVLFFFTPIGLFLFRGSMHTFVGAILKSSGISKKFGDNLMTGPKKWLKHENGSVRAAFALYMHNDFIPQYKNNITAIAFMGTAFLILNIGLRGVKFMTAHQPDLIVIAIIVEITVLLLLGMTTWYEKEEDEDQEGGGQKIPGKQLSLADVERRLDALKSELEASVRTETGLRHQ